MYLELVQDIPEVVEVRLSEDDDVMHHNLGSPF